MASEFCRKRGARDVGAADAIRETIYEEFSEPGYGMGFFLGRFAAKR